MTDVAFQPPAPTARARAHETFDLIVYRFATTLERAIDLIEDGEAEAARAWLQEASAAYREHLFSGEA